MINRFVRFLRRHQNTVEEILWANIWHDTIRGISWLEDFSYVTPGRMAVGYNYLYVMTRVLEEIKPNSVLDLGLGLSSRLISRYFSEYGREGYEHLIIEHDKMWGEFFLKRQTISSYSKIGYLERIIKTKGKDEYYAYEEQGLKKLLQGKKYSVISIDAPQGYLRQYSRRDIIPFLPQILQESWVILIDDAERIGEKRTIADIKEILRKHNVEYAEGLYKGTSHLKIITSKDNAFLCTL